MSALSFAAQAAIHAGVDRFRGFRAIASVVMARYARDLSDGWKPDSSDERHMSRICRRFKVGDAFAAMHAGYVKDKMEARK